MLENDPFSNKQHGFVPNRNCMTNMLICLEIWTNLIEKDLPIDIIYIDVTNAFDRVPQQPLLTKMYKKTFDWFEAFLKTTVRMGGKRVLLLKKSQKERTTGICTGTNSFRRVHKLYA